jgi:hypothetical protein
VALHSAVALASAGDVAGLVSLGRHCRRSQNTATRTIVATICDALAAASEERWGDTWRLLADVMPVLVRVGGSLAQREVVEETLLYALVCDGQAERARALLDERLDRRTSPLDARRRRSLAPAEASVASAI